MSIYNLTYIFFCIGTVLGGTMELHGTNISLACFHGNSLKAKSWALFSLKEPCISFATEAQQVANDDGQLTGFISTSELLKAAGDDSSQYNENESPKVCVALNAKLVNPSTNSFSFF